MPCLSLLWIDFEKRLVREPFRFPDESSRGIEDLLKL